MSGQQPSALEQVLQGLRGTPAPQPYGQYNSSSKAQYESSMLSPPSIEGYSGVSSMYNTDQVPYMMPMPMSQYQQMMLPPPEYNSPGRRTPGSYGKRQQQRPAKPADLAEVFSNNKWLDKKQKIELSTALIVDDIPFEEVMKKCRVDPEVLKVLRQAGKRKVNDALLPSVTDKSIVGKKLLSTLPGKIKKQLKGDLETKPFTEALSLNFEEEAKKVLLSQGKKFVNDTAFDGKLELFQKGSSKRSRDDAHDASKDISPTKMPKTNGVTPRDEQAVKDGGAFAELPSTTKLALKRSLESKKFKEAIDSALPEDAQTRVVLIRLGRARLKELISEYFGEELVLFAGSRTPLAEGETRNEANAKKKALDCKEVFSALGNGQKTQLREALASIGFKEAIFSIGAETASANVMLNAGREVLKSILTEHFGEEVVIAERGLLTKSFFTELSDEVKQQLLEKLKKLPMKVALDSIVESLDEEEQLKFKKIRGLKPFALKESIIEHFGLDKNDFTYESENALREKIVEEIRGQMDAITMHALRRQLQKVHFEQAIQAEDLDISASLRTSLKAIGERRMKTLLEEELGEIVLCLSDVLTLKFSQLPNTPMTSPKDPSKGSGSSKSQWKEAFTTLPFEEACDSLQVSDEDKALILACGKFAIRLVLERHYGEKIVLKGAGKRGGVSSDQ